MLEAALKPGKYRLVKSFNPKDQEFKLAAEFEVIADA
jgi:hypothetical protein